MQTAQKKTEDKQSAPIQRKRKVKMDGNVAYIYTGATKRRNDFLGDSGKEREKHKKTNPRYRNPALAEEQHARQKAKQQQEADIKEVRANRKKAVSTILVIFIAFCAVALLISRFALICEIGTKNNKLQSSIDNVNNQIEELKAEMELKGSLKDIQDTAINQFGMTYPDESQKVHLDMD